MKKILLLGAGRSSYSLIQYLIKLVQQNQWQLTVGDNSIDAVNAKLKAASNTSAIAFDVDDIHQREQVIKDSDLVISLLPPPFHYKIAVTCLQFSKHLLTASYVSEEINNLDKQAKDKGVLILMETGLDPGIDHMSAKLEIDRIKEEGGKLVAFKSYTGGLVAPESDNNPWNYKVTWNPRNVVLAGQGTVKYLEKGAYKFIPYHHLFTRTETVYVDGYGSFEGYANRDSLKYISIYGLEGTPSFIRGTLRKPGFCSAWNVLVQLGLTEDSYEIDNLSSLSYSQFTESFLPEGEGSLRKRIADYLNIAPEAEVLDKVEWLGLLEDKKIGLSKGTPANILQKLIEEKWQLGKEDKDMIVMQHQYEYELQGKRKKLVSSLVVKGENSSDTAMAKTVGLPLGIAAKLILQNKIALTGVHIPIRKEIYAPILKELAELGIKFINEEEIL